MPAAAADDTALVGGSTSPNLQAAADAMAAAMNQMNGNGSVTPDNNGSGAQQPSTGDTESVGIDYVTLTSPATTIDGQRLICHSAPLSAHSRIRR